MRLALVHDWLNTLGGAERVLIELHKIFPDAPIYTLFYNKKFRSQYLPNADIRPSFLQKFPLITRHHKLFAILMPSAIESFDLSDFDTVISSSVFFSKGLVLRPKTRHICYCYSPTRQLWDLNKLDTKIGNLNLEIGTSVAKHLLRLWDRQAADRVDEFVAISEIVRSRIQKYYKRDAKVIYPPITLNPKLETLNSKPQYQGKARYGARQTQNDYYLIVSRLYPHKNIDVAVEAFAKLNLPLIIIGDGPEYKNLKSQISNLKNVKMLGFVPDKDIPSYYQNCLAFIMPQEEDFGITPIEAMSYGKPVLALKRGGALEYVQEGVNGEFFDDPTEEVLADGVRRLKQNLQNYNSVEIKKSAERYSADRFKKEILEFIISMDSWRKPQTKI